ncbi:PAXNEB-domain-containing protein [Echria macrotheca]|uniref:Elongator complex protein 4 n=1 Tax=Echria macrotheca TaxID=438768 RepID=A0AAJ0F5P4_9PEZI|nr:PAXNEB-domain-containing protein [Echria macrotheca]
MSFTKRNAVLSSPRSGNVAVQTKTEKQLAAGVRPSPLDGRATTSTGTSSLDQLLAGHNGLPLGTCLLIEEQGTTDFSGILLRYYAAEGLVQGHQVHLVGYPQEWKHQLPGLASPDTKSKTSQQPSAVPEEKMKIAWRYEALGNASIPGGSTRTDSSSATTFCHSFDLSKRLSPAVCKGTLHPTPSTGPPSLDIRSSASVSPFKAIIKSLRAKLEASPPSEIHRLVVPSLLSPALYAPSCAQPTEILQFLHGIRALLRQYSSQLTAIITLPTSLFPRSTGLVRWMELLCDGVVELIPLPANPAAPPPSSSKSDPKPSDQPQGLLNVYTLPIYHEKGGGGAETSAFRETLSFSLSASKGLAIKPYSLPPMEDDTQKENVADRQVRISRIGGRYLLFDLDDVAYIRRHHGICAIFTGTMPQGPTQNVFLGLPIELYAEEARLLLDKKAAYLVDEAAEHLSQLKAMDSSVRKDYLDSLKAQRKSAQLAFENTRKVQRSQALRERQAKAKVANKDPDSAAQGDGSLFDSRPATPASVSVVKPKPPPALTPTTSKLQVSKSASRTRVETPPSDPLLAYLNSRGYYITPGLRFGGDYSVYPGDPFRYHAHYLANSYGWDQEIPMLDLITSGRLGTAVKKSFMFGAKKPVEGDSEEEDAGAGVRVFCIEWAGM